MKIRILLLCALSLLTAASAFGQGKVSFGNDSNHLICFTSEASWLPARYRAYAGQAVPQSVLIDFTAELWGSANAASLVLQKSMVAGRPGFDDGRLANALVTLSGMASGTPGYFQVRIYETAAGSWVNASAQGWLASSSPVFTTIPGALTYNSIVSSIAPANSTWAAGRMIMGIPEPSTLGLMGLGLAGLALARRRPHASPHGLSTCQVPAASGMVRHGSNQRV